MVVAIIVEAIIVLGGVTEFEDVGVTVEGFVDVDGLGDAMVAVATAVVTTVALDGGNEKAI